MTTAAQHHDHAAARPLAEFVMVAALVGAGVIVVALLIDQALAKYVILPPGATPARTLPDVDASDDEPTEGI